MTSKKIIKNFQTTTHEWKIQTEHHKIFEVFSKFLGRKIFLGFCWGLLITKHRLSYRLSKSVVWLLQKQSLRRKIFLGFCCGLLITKHRLSYRLSKSVVWLLQKQSLKKKRKTCLWKTLDSNYAHLFRLLFFASWWLFWFWF